MPEIIDTAPVEDGRYIDEAEDDEDLIGARYRQTLRIGRHLKQVESDVTLYHPPWLLGLRLTCDSFKIILTFDVYPVGSGTRLDYRADIIVTSWAAPLLEIVNRPRCARIMSAHLTNLKALAEEPVVPDFALDPEDQALMRHPIAAE